MKTLHQCLWLHGTGTQMPRDSVTLRLNLNFREPFSRHPLDRQAFIDRTYYNIHLLFASVESGKNDKRAKQSK